MKYWVYKESRILGPFDKEGVSGLPGLDSGTLVCEGDPAGGSWLPAGEIKDLGGIKVSSFNADFGEPPSTIGLLDQLQIDASGLIGDDDFPGSLAEDLFQDASFKKGFGDVLSSDAPSDGVEAARARQKAAEMTVQLEKLYKHIAELETTQADLMRRLAEKERESLQQETGVSESAAPAKTFLSPAPEPKAAAPAPPPSGLEPAPAPSDWSETKGAGSPLPAIFDAPPPTKAVVPGVPVILAPPELPAMPSFAPPAAPPAGSLPPMPSLGLPADAAAAPAPEPPAPKTVSFGKPKSFKIVPTLKSFKVIGASDAAPADAAPAPVFSEPAPAPTPAPAAVIPPPPAVIPPPPAVIAPPEPAPEIVPVQLAPAPVPEPASFNPFTVPTPQPAPPVPTPVAPPPNTLSRSQPVPDLGATVQASADDLAGSADLSAPPATLARGRGAMDAPVTPEVAARFAKPAPAPATSEPKPARSNKKFLIAGGILVILLVIVGVIFMRQPKDDLKQMATLDDGKAPIGLQADDSATAPPIVKPKIAEPAPAPVPAPPPGPSAEHQAAITAVKEFPLDGGRGTVGRWLQYSYTASPGAGTEEWNASTTGENNMLVEYRLVPGAAGGNGALYLFEVDGNGLVMGKNLEARQMLAGSPPAEPAKPKKAKAPAKKAVKRRPVVEEPKEVPLLPLPDSGELRPPAEDDGTFGTDTINSGI